MSPRDTEDVLIEATLSARRERDREGLPLPSPAWADLSAEGRLRAFDRALAWREVERLSGYDGLSSTARAVLARIS